VKSREIFRFEVGYRLRQPSTWAYAAVLFGVPFLLMHAINGSSLPLNAPIMVANASTILATVGLVVSAALFGDAATRDVHTRMHALFYTAPLRESEYLGARFLGTLLVNAVLTLGIPLGLAAAAVMPYMSPGKFGPFQAATYVQPYLAFVLPNLVLGGAVLYAIAALTRQTLATYLGVVGLFMLRGVATEIARSLHSDTFAALADPAGSAAIEGITSGWTPVEQGTRLLGFPPLLLWNRALWLGVSVALLALLVGRFRFAHPGGEGRRRWRRRRTVRDTAEVRATAVTVPAARRAFDARTRLRQTWAVAGRALRDVVSNRAFLVVLAGAVFLEFAVGWDVGSELFETSTWPVTHLIAGTVVAGVVSGVVVLLISLFAGELVWRERDVRLAEIADVAPVPEWVSLLGRFAALVAMILMLQLTFTAAGVALQLMQGFHAIEPSVYLRLLFGVKLVDFVLVAALAMAVHVIVDQKYVAHLIVVLYYVFTQTAGLVGVRHHMLIYASDPGWIYSDLNGLGPFVVPWLWFKLYWAAWALLLAVLTTLFWRRGREPKRRLALARRRLTRRVLGTAVTAGALVLTLGGFVFYNTNVLNTYRSPEEAAALRAEYETRYKRFDGAPLPTIVGAALRVELWAERSAADVRGTYYLVNRTGRAIDSVHVLLSPDVTTRAVGFDRAARPVLHDAVHLYRIYALERPVLPGDSLRLTFDVAFAPRGFANDGVPTAVTRNGAYFDARWFPAIGYQPGREIEDADDRRALGLPPRRPEPDPRDSAARMLLPDRLGGSLVDVETVIGTDARQIAVTPGTLRREWREGGRRYFLYRTETPLPFGAPVLSAEYAVREGRWHDVPLRVYYHPTHTYNVDRILRGMRDALEYYSTSFGPYQFRELRVVEFPRYMAFARAHPYTIAYSEGSAFLTRVDSGDVDRPFFVTAHETAHQWWPGQVMPANVLGRPLVTETLAQYGAMMVMEHTYGPDMVRRFAEFNMQEYFRGRTVYTNREVPLLEVSNQRYLFYFKGAVAMYTLRERIGEDRVNEALRRYRARFLAGTPPYPTSLDLYAELKAVTPDSLKPLLGDLFERITLWRLSAKAARAEPLGGGAYRVTLDVTASKVLADSVGRETRTPMDDLVEIGVFAAGTGGASGTPLHLAQHRIREGEQRIVVTVRGEPALAGIDPRHQLLDRERDDNVVGVQRAAAVTPPASPPADPRASPATPAPRTPPPPR
jgi:hypothetical protein